MRVTRNRSGLRGIIAVLEVRAKVVALVSDARSTRLHIEYLKLSGKTAIDDGDEGFSAFVEQERQEHLKEGCTWAAKTKDEYLQAPRKQKGVSKRRRPR
jgi:hypothetical protein